MAFYGKIDGMDELEFSKQDDARIWRGLGRKSPRVIAAELGRTPEEVLRRKEELLGVVDSLTLREMRAKFMVDLQGIAEDAWERSKGIEDRAYGSAITAASGAMKTLLGEIARMEKQSSGEVEALNQKRVQELVSLMREVIDLSVVEIATKHDLPEAELFDVFNARLVQAAQKRDLES